MSADEKAAAFEEILERYKKEIFNYCFQKLSHNKWIMEEAVEYVFVHLFLMWDRLVIGKDIRAYGHISTERRISWSKRSSGKNRSIRITTYFLSNHKKIIRISVFVNPFVPKKG